jgi:putative hemolysin
MTVLIISIFAAITISFVCSLAEACLLSLSRPDIARLSENKPAASAIWQKLKQNIQQPLSAVLVINTGANVIGAFFSGREFNKLFGDSGSIIFSVVLSYILIQWCEILPKTIAVKHSRVIAGIIARPFNGLVILLTPLIHAIEFMNRPFAGKHSTAESAVSDIRVLARSAALDNLISKEQESLISRSMHLSNLTAKDIMIDREDINVLSTSMSLTDGLIAAHLQRHTRFPLTESGDIDKIIGYANFKDIVGALHVNPADPSLRGIMRPVSFVKADTKLPVLMKQLTRGYQHIAIVQDEKGKTIGLITLEDIIETLVGELQDEYDTPPDFIIRLSETRFRIGGNATFRQLKMRAFPTLDRSDDMTIDGWFKQMSTAGTTPPENYSAKVGNISFKIRRIVRGNIYDIVAEEKK